MDVDDLIATMTDLCGLDAPPGFEAPAMAYFRDRLVPVADEVRLDAFGNLVAVRNGPEGAPRIMVSAHADEVAMIVTRIENNGFVRFTPLGCPTAQLLPGRRVRAGRSAGVIGVKSDHLMTREEREHRTVPDAGDLYIDLGATSGEEVLAMGVRVGTPVTHVSEVFRLGESRRYAGKAIDNRLSCALLLHLFAELHGRQLPATVLGVITVQEEVGMRGASMVAFRERPDLALVIDVTICEDTPEFPAPAVGSRRLGGGPVIHILEQSPASGRGMIAHPKMVEAVLSRAVKAGIPHQTAVFIGGATDAAHIHLSRGGVPACYLGIPCRYAHSPVEVFDVDDALAAFALAKEFLASPPPLSEIVLVEP